jgi:hypothetical protein
MKMLPSPSIKPAKYAFCGSFSSSIGHPQIQMLSVIVFE